MKKKAIFVRKLRGEEEKVLKKATCSADACEMKRAQIVLASSQGLTTTGINKRYGYSTEYARKMIHRFNKQGVSCLKRKSSAPLTIKSVFDRDKCEKIKKIMHKNPRGFGKASSIWTLTLMAEVLYEEGETPRQMANETLRRAMKKNGVNWKRAKDWITSPDPQYEIKKSNETD
jgi:transposase